ncbi:hypothetical protein PJK45_00445 [Mycobacterium kansasii]|uniref:hypothetical protein n=1 Tax=Mycobacterium kansasii TaxID=1768 RepID=UPI00111C83B0|nr:hypothetical protein [Mycobacterium kansasii]UCA17965.1 hypothetical protein LA359_16955 [Mycobacterium kansasii]UGT82823.1 hypothetical protein LTS70_09005 [Mycobacterium kansasii]UGT87101.1 hypothetical protein LTT71_02405 [Mycobacterium kansasii]UGU24635.1 hypothetical protein LT351_25085 [Mycobacterium kansasii]
MSVEAVSGLNPDIGRTLPDALAQRFEQALVIVAVQFVGVEYEHPIIGLQLEIAGAERVHAVDYGRIGGPSSSTHQ